jgi:hypothetical protein
MLGISWQVAKLSASEDGYRYVDLGRTKTDAAGVDTFLCRNVLDRTCGRGRTGDIGGVLTQQFRRIRTKMLNLAEDYENKGYLQICVA